MSPVTRTKFRPDVIQRVLKAASVGCSQETCASLAGIDQSTLSRWLATGKEQLERAEDLENLPSLAQFAHDFYQCQASTNERALAIVYREMDTNPMLAWKYVERREKGYAPPAPALPERTAGPVVIQLTLSNGVPLEDAPRTVIDVEDPDGAARDGTQTEPTGSALASVVPLADGSGE